ncbi:hypothetical protein N658DRAFT_75625 [Parathielavia hyrcaniae]|uniref:Uncharacterized protein n=1 Tax=Parathielavia hyrcaniae TaxID=113614 RepID=A0AAN6Q1D5_9PEZI|nr:hypothetical protein N658DRAFT_75625 [Parathielavia hyrcaniae]
MDCGCAGMPCLFVARIVSSTADVVLRGSLRATGASHIDLRCFNPSGRCSKDEPLNIQPSQLLPYLTNHELSARNVVMCGIIMLLLCSKTARDGC